MESYVLFFDIDFNTHQILPSTILALTQAKAILAKYSYKILKLPNQKYNVKLKLVADASGINKSVSSHGGRGT
jgi:hypothetical protein